MLYKFISTTIFSLLITQIIYAQTDQAKPISLSDLPPGVVTIVELTPTSATITWTPVPGINIYQITTVATSPGNVPPVGNTNFTTYVINGLSPGTSYSTLVEGITQGGSDEVGTVEFTTPYIIIIKKVIEKCVPENPQPVSPNHSVTTTFPFNEDYWTVTLKKSSNSISFVLAPQTLSIMEYGTISTSGNVSVEPVYIPGTTNRIKSINIRFGQTIVAKISSGINAISAEPFVSLNIPVNGIYMSSCYGTSGLAAPDEDDVLESDAVVDRNADIDVSSTLTDYQISPNPSNGLYNVIAQFPQSGLVEVQVVDITGHSIHTATGLTTDDTGYFSTQLDLTNFASGLYIVNFRTPDGVKTCKVVKQ